MTKLITCFILNFQYQETMNQAQPNPPLPASTQPPPLPPEEAKPPPPPASAPGSTYGYNSTVSTSSNYQTAFNATQDKMLSPSTSTSSTSYGYSTTGPIVSLHSQKIFNYIIVNSQKMCFI